MFKERIQEIYEFTKSESPYRKANKGWINQDVFLDLSPSPDKFLQRNEAAKVTVFWSPINTLLSNIFTIIIISSLLVFTSLSFAKGKFNFNLFHNPLINDLVKIEDNKFLKTNDLKDLDSINYENKQTLEINQSDKINRIELLDDNQITSDKDKITTESDKKDALTKDNKNKIDIKISENKKSKSNFI